MARKSGDISSSILVALLAAAAEWALEVYIIMITYNKVILLLLSNVDTRIFEVYTSLI